MSKMILSLVHAFRRIMRPTHYFVMDGNILFSFSKPDSEQLAKLEEAISFLPPAAIASMDPNRQVDVAHMIGDQRETMDSIRKALEIDYAERIGPGAERWKGAFEYVVRHDNPKGPARLLVLTRLYALGHPGGVYYGCAIQRLPDGRLALWVDND